MTTKIDTSKTFKRSFTFERADGAIDEEARTVEVAFSSEEPYERHFGIEILDHSPESVDLSRLNNGGAVLVGHNHDDQVGVVESARIDSDRVARAVIRFGKSLRASEIFEDVKDGIRKLISVGYRVNKYEVTENESGPDEVRVVDSTPFEISFVSVPADPTVGVGRSDDPENSEQEKVIMSDKDKKIDDDQTRDDDKAAPKVDVKAERAQARKDEQDRIRKIVALGDKHDLEDLAREYVDGDYTVNDFQARVLEEIGKRNAEVRETNTEDDESEIGLTEREIENFSFVRVMRALANPQNPKAQEAAGFEREVSEAGAAKLGIEARGFFIPVDVTDGGMKRTLSAGTATDGAELVAQDLLAGSYIDVLRNSMALAGAGARFLPGLVGNVDIPRQTAGAAASWISAEDGDASESEAQFDQVQMTPKDLGAYTEVTRRLMQQSTPAIEGIIRQDLIIAAALGIDAAGMYGSGASGQPTGISNQTGINTNNLTLAAPTWAEVLGVVSGQMDDNALMGSLGWLISPTIWSLLSSTEKATNTAQFLLDNMNMAGYGVTVSQQVQTNDHFFGNFNDLLVGQWGGLEMNVDPYTHSLKGRTRFVMFQTVDLAVRHGESFNHNTAA